MFPAMLPGRGAAFGACTGLAAVAGDHRALLPSDVELRKGPFPIDDVAELLGILLNCSHEHAELSMVRVGLAACHGSKQPR